MSALLLGALLALAAAPAGAQTPELVGRAVVPQMPRGYNTELETDARAFKKIGPWRLMGEAALRWQGERRQRYQALTLGSYYRVHRNLNVGAFYKLQLGARYDEDWQKIAVGPGWVWRDTTRRDEHVAVIDATPRFFVPFTDNATIAFKTQLHWNTFNSSHWLRFSPEVTYHFMSGLTPVGSLTLQYDSFLRLDRGYERLFDQWLYLGGLWHACPRLSVGPRVGVRQWVFHDTQAFRSATGANYRVVYRALVLGLDVVTRL